MRQLGLYCLAANNKAQSVSSSAFLATVRSSDQAPVASTKAVENAPMQPAAEYELLLCFFSWAFNGIKWPGSVEYPSHLKSSP